MEYVQTPDRGSFWLEGPLERVHCHESTVISTGSFVNTIGGSVTLERHAFLGTWVMLLTGSHDYSKYGHERMHGGIYEGRNSDIILHEGAWVASGAIVIGPCEIGEHAVIGAGSVVTGKIPAYALMRPIYAQFVRDIRDPWPWPPR